MMYRIFRSSFAGVALLALSILHLAAAQPAPPTLRLPGDVIPLSYAVSLQLAPEQASFSGEMQIAIDVKHPVETIWLNGSQLSVSQAHLEHNGGTLTGKPVGNGGKDFIGITFDAALTPGRAKLIIEYTGHIRQQDSSAIFHMEEDGNQFLFTQFESTDARAAFPCFDEPSYKVPWQLTLAVPAGDDVVSNTPVESEQTSGSKKEVRFRQSKPLPSYLVAFAVGKFDFVPAGFAGRNRAPVRIVTPRGHAREAKYAAEVTATILTRLEDYFGIPFPYEKSDQLALPSTFGFGAMENAGLVTYSQQILLANPDRDPLTRQRSYASVAAHELAHQWFGDFVTTAWWNDIWLNEAFATWMEQKLIAGWKPEWETRVDDVNSKLRAQNEDTLLSARKVRQEIKSKDDISNAFDGITYDKGAAVIGMFESWMGEAAFRRGVQAYLKKYAFKNATAPEFLEAVSTAGGKSITESFSTFLNQPGVPLVSVSLECRKGGDGAVIHLTQERSLNASPASGIQGEPSAKQNWQIPVCVRYGSNGASKSACTLLSDPRSDWRLPGGGNCPAWLNANDGAKGYYRVAYSSDLLKQLTAGDPVKRLSGPERVDLIGNAEALAETGRIADSDVLALVTKFKDDPNRYVMERLIAVASQPREHLVPAQMEDKYRSFVVSSFGPRARNLGWTPKPGENDDARLLRPRLLQFVATTGGDQMLANEATELTKKWLADHSVLQPGLAGAVLGTAAYYGDENLFNQLLDAFKASHDRQEHRQILGALATFRDRRALEAGMKAVLTGDVPFIEAFSLLSAGQGYPATRKVAFQFMQQHFEALAERRPTGGGADAGARFVQVGRSFCDDESAAELKAFFTPRVDQFVGAPRVLAQTLERVQACIANKAKQEGSVEEFLKGF